MYNSCVHLVLSYCTGVWVGVSQCTSRCDDQSRINRKLVRNMFPKIFINSCCIFREARILKIYDINKLMAASYMYNILKHNKNATLRSSFYVSYPSHNCHAGNRNDILLPYPRVEAIRTNFRYQIVKIWLGVPEYIKCQ